MTSVNSPGPDYAWASLSIDPDKVVELTHSLISAGVRYRLGAKVVPLSLQADRIRSVDCSGFVRWAIYHATGQTLEIPDGSSNQHDWIKQAGFKPSNFDGGFENDGIVRIAFLSPEDGGGVGHVMLIVNRLTCESHGGFGPDQRRWGGSGFMSKCAVYALTGGRN